MKKIIIKKIRLLETNLLRILKLYFNDHRLRTYIIFSLIVVLILLSKIPYVNLVVFPFENLLIIYLIILAIVGPIWRNLLIVGILSFIPLLVLTVLGNGVLAEHLANVTYLVLVSATILLLKEVMSTND